jgi:hypothetical protein
MNLEICTVPYVPFRRHRAEVPACFDRQAGNRSMCNRITTTVVSTSCYDHVISYEALSGSAYEPFLMTMLCYTSVLFLSYIKYAIVGMRDPLKIIP